MTTRSEAINEIVTDGKAPLGDRSDKIDYLVNSCGFTEKSLEGMGDRCLARTALSFAIDDPNSDFDRTELNEISSNSVDFVTNEMDGDIEETVLKASKLGYLNGYEHGQQDVFDEYVVADFDSVDSFFEMVLEQVDAEQDEQASNGPYRHKPQKSANYSAQIGGEARGSKPEKDDTSGWENRASKRIANNEEDTES
jgi:hypothetical protein